MNSRLHTIKVVVLALLLLSWEMPALASDCSYRLVSEFAFAAVDIQHQREKIQPDISPEFLISTPLRLQRTIEESALHFSKTFADCKFSVPEITSVIAGTLLGIGDTGSWSEPEYSGATSNRGKR